MALQWGPKTADTLSDCHLNKQRLINSLEAEVNESTDLMHGPQATPPYKISRFHWESHMGEETVVASQ